MKASELIEQLQAAIKEHGDLPYGEYDPEWGIYIEPGEAAIKFIPAQPGDPGYYDEIGPMLGLG